MGRDTENTDSIRDYLLGELSEPEREQVECRLLVDDDYYEQLLISEDELVDDFVGDRLDEPERAKFSRHFLTVPELRQDVRFAKSLRVATGARAAPARPSPWGWLASFFRLPVVGFALAATLILAVSVAVLMTAQNRRLRTQLEQLQARQTSPAQAESPPPTPQTALQEQLTAERQRGEQLAAELRRAQEQRADAERKLEEQNRQSRQTPPRGQEPQPVVASVLPITLTSGLVRGPGEEWKTISLPRGTRRVLAQLDLDADDYVSCRATLRTVEGRQLFISPSLRARAGDGARSVFVSIPARFLAPGDYQISLDGKTPAGKYADAGTYYLRVVR